MKKQTMWFLSALCLILGIAVFVGCGQSTGVDPAAERAAVGNDHPTGTWQNLQYGEQFIINEKVVSYSITGYGVVYEGDFEDWVDDTDDTDSGIVFLKYTIAPYGVPGNYYAVRWQELNVAKGTVWLSGCADAKGKTTLKEAEAEYTEANKEKYFATGSDCTRTAKPWENIEQMPLPAEKSPYLKYLEEKTGIILFE
jgi:hypothetical protein